MIGKAASIAAFPCCRSRPSRCSAGSSWRAFRGTEIIRLRQIAPLFDQPLGLDAALKAVAGGNSAVAAEHLAKLDQQLAALPGTRQARAANPAAGACKHCCVGGGTYPASRLFR